VSYTPQLLYSRAKGRLYSLNSSLGGLRSWHGIFGEQEKTLAQAGNRTLVVKTEKDFIPFYIIETCYVNTSGMAKFSALFGVLT
jgi:hypothetical protein